MIFIVQISNLQSVFFRPALETPDNLEKTNFSGMSRFSRVGLKKWTSAFVSAGQKNPSLIPRQFEKITRGVSYVGFPIFADTDADFAF